MLWTLRSLSYLNWMKMIFSVHRTGLSATEVIENQDIAGTVSDMLCPDGEKPVKCNKGSKRYRKIDGTCNNLVHTSWGSALSAEPRFLPSDYSDGSTFLIDFSALFLNSTIFLLLYETPILRKVCASISIPISDLHEKRIIVPDNKAVSNYITFVYKSKGLVMKLGSHQVTRCRWIFFTITNLFPSRSMILTMYCLTFIWFLKYTKPLSIIQTFTFTMKNS